MRGQGDSLHYPGESAPGPRSLPGHRTTCTKDEEHLNSWVHPCFPQTTLGSSLSWAIKKRIRGGWSSSRQCGFREHPLLRTEVSTLKEGPVIKTQNTGRTWPGGSGWTHCWIPADTEERPQVWEHQPGPHTVFHDFSPISWPVFQRKPVCLTSSALGHINWSEPTSYIFIPAFFLLESV